MTFLQGLRVQKTSQTYSDENKLKETALHPLCGSDVESAGMVGERIEFIKHLEGKKISEDNSRRIHEH